MKKLLILMLSILILSSVSFGYENITIIPEEITTNNTVYIVYNMEYPFPISNFSLNIESNGITFNNNSIYINQIAENSNISGKIVGTITNSSLTQYNISILERYYSNGSVISSVMHYHIYRVNFTSNESWETNNPLNNSHIASNESCEITASASNNSSNVISNVSKSNLTNNVGESSNSAENSSGNSNPSHNESTIVSTNANINTNNNNNSGTNVNNENTANESSSDYILYGILGLIMGILVAIIVVYLYDL